MKKCPQCERTYSDESLAFCLEDGSLLSAPLEGDKTIALPSEVVTVIRQKEPISKGSDLIDRTRDFKIEASTLRAYVMIVVLGIIWMYFHWATDSIFLTPRNLSNLMTQMSVTAILAVGMLMVIVSGNIDLSVGSALGFAGGIAAYAITILDYGLPVAIVSAIVVGVLIGLFHGALTAYLNIPAFIVTLGGLLGWRGAVKWLLGGNTIPISNETFKAIGNNNLPLSVGWGLAAAA